MKVDIVKVKEKMFDFKGTKGLILLPESDLDWGFLGNLFDVVNECSNTTFIIDVIDNNFIMRNVEDNE